MKTARLSVSVMTSALIMTASLLAFPAAAQEPAAMERMERIERDLMLLQRQVARTPINRHTSSMPVVSEADVPPDGAAGLEVRLSAIEEELRAINGKVEENEFQVRKLSETMEKFQRDVEFRFSEGTSGAAGVDGEPAATGPAKTEDGGSKVLKVDTQSEAKTPVENPQPGDDGRAQPKDTTAGDGVMRLPDKNENFATPRDLYNHAFRLLNQTKYEEASSAFDRFTKKYPKDPLIGNAYYWQGETFYIRRDYVNAADNFRQGFEAMPSGPKAPDNLLKLAMSLDALNRDKEACIVLQQVVSKFKSSSTSVTARAEQERKRIGC